MSVFANTSIRRQLTLIIVSISAIAVLITTSAITFISVHNQRQEIEEELMVAAKLVGERNRAVISFGYDEDAMQNMQVFSDNPSIIKACLYDDSGAVFATYPTPAEIPDIFKHCPAADEPLMDNGDTLQVRREITSEPSGEHIGSIYIESDLSRIDRYFRQQALTALIVAVVVFAVSYLLAMRVQRAISQPILSLAETARQVSHDRDYSVRAKKQNVISEGKDENEIDTLIYAFNRMLSEIEERERQLLRTNEELYEAKEAAEMASRAKSQFLANISHELRTPLNAIIGFSSILMNQLFGNIGSDKYIEYSRDINESGVHLLDIINDILDLSKAEAGKLKLSFEEVDVDKAINKCITILSERAMEAKVQIIVDIPENLPKLVVDRLRFIQIVLNILSNAVKFTDEGGKVTIRVMAQTDNAGSTTGFIMEIEDTGIGMAQEDIEKAFQSFGQLDSGLNRKYEGTGLGLPLTKKLVELHHGTIRLESRLKEGTKVITTFPATPPAISVSDSSS